MFSCLVDPCTVVTDCPLEGGCVVRRFGEQSAALVEPSDLKDNARALAGTVPRASRDPHKIKRKRKALT